jgi:hypothetical protein
MCNLDDPVFAPLTIQSRNEMSEIMPKRNVIPERSVLLGSNTNARTHYNANRKQRTLCNQFVGNNWAVLCKVSITRLIRYLWI